MYKRVMQACSKIITFRYDISIFFLVKMSCNITDYLIGSDSLLK